MHRLLPLPGMLRLLLLLPLMARLLLLLLPTLRLPPPRRSSKGAQRGNSLTNYSIEA